MWRKEVLLFSFNSKMLQGGGTPRTARLWNARTTKNMGGGHVREVGFQFKLWTYGYGLNTLRSCDLIGHKPCQPLVMMCTLYKNEVCIVCMTYFTRYSMKTLAGLILHRDHLITPHANRSESTQTYLTDVSGHLIPSERFLRGTELHSQVWCFNFALPPPQNPPHSPSSPSGWVSDVISFTPSRSPSVLFSQLATGWCLF